MRNGEKFGRFLKLESEDSPTASCNVCKAEVSHVFLFFTYTFLNAFPKDRIGKNRDRIGCKRNVIGTGRIFIRFPADVWTTFLRRVALRHVSLQYDTNVAKLSCSYVSVVYHHLIYE